MKQMDNRQLLHPTFQGVQEEIDRRHQPRVDFSRNLGFRPFALFARSLCYVPRVRIQNASLSPSPSHFMTQTGNFFLAEGITDLSSLSMLQSWDAARYYSPSVHLVRDQSNLLGIS